LEAYSDSPPIAVFRFVLEFLTQNLDEGKDLPRLIFIMID